MRSSSRALLDHMYLRTVPTYGASPNAKHALSLRPSVADVLHATSSRRDDVALEPAVGSLGIVACQARPCSSWLTGKWPTPWPKPTSAAATRTVPSLPYLL
ncbi:hypothetical protein PMIN03_004084 [Paraphaeosphaeria minitans]